MSFDALVCFGIVMIICVPARFFDAEAFFHANVQESGEIMPDPGFEAAYRASPHSG